jgi:hypothetical protein
MLSVLRYIKYAPLFSLLHITCHYYYSPVNVPKHLKHAFDAKNIFHTLCTEGNQEHVRVFDFS